MNIKRLNQKIIGMAPTQSLASMADKSKFTLLAEKFLVASHQKSVVTLRALAEREKRMRLFWSAIACLPLGILAYFFVPPHYFERLLRDETLCRASVSLMLGCALANAAFLERIGLKAFLFIPLSFLFCFRMASEDFFLFLLGEEVNARLFLALGSGFLLPPLIYLPSYALWRLRCYLADAPLTHRFFGFADEQELERHLQNALKHAGEVRAKELEKLVKDWAPEYTHIIENLHDSEVEVGAFAEVVHDKSAVQGMSYFMYLGGNQAGKPIYIDLDASPHMLVAGTTGAGKSNFVEYYLCTLLDRGDCDIALIDPSDDLYGYASHPQVSYITRVEAARHAVARAASEMTQRAELFKSKKGVRKLSDWKGEDAPRRLFLIFDEFADFSEDAALRSHLIQIVRKGRKYGIHVLLATQSPRADVFPGVIKDNINTRLAFRAATAAHAAVLGEPLARSIKEEQKGLALFQGAFVQTPLNDNRRWWDEDVPEEKDIPALPEGGGQEGLELEPSEKGEEGAVFMTKAELQERLGGDPEALGFKPVRVRVRGVRQRGCWVKKST